MQFVYCSKVYSAVYGIGVQRWVTMNYVVWLNWALTMCLLLLGTSQRSSLLLDTVMLPILIFHMRKLRLQSLGTWYTGYTESNCKACGCSLKPLLTGSQDCLAASSAAWSYALSGLWWDFWLPRYVSKKSGVQEVLKHCVATCRPSEEHVGMDSWVVVHGLSLTGWVTLGKSSFSCGLQFSFPTRQETTWRVVVLNNTVWIKILATWRCS